MLVALTVERYLAVCRLGQTRAFAAKKTPIVALGLALLAVSLYLPYLFRAHVITCSSLPDGLPVYRKRENPSFAHSTLWAVYLWILEVIFKVNDDYSTISPSIIKVYKRKRENQTNFHLTLRKGNFKKPANLEHIAC